MAENQGVMPPALDEPVGMVRVLVGDTDPKPVEGSTGMGQYAWYSDDELEALLPLHRNNPKRVAIWVLSMVGISQALLLKKWTSEDLQVDGPAIMKGIEATLKRLSAEVEAEDALENSAEFFGIYGPTHERPRLPIAAVPTHPWGW